MQDQLFLRGFVVLSIYMCVIFSFMLLEHYLLQFYLSFVPLLISIVEVD